ncbi:trypsin-like peptidase domain-containing protein [Streptomyces litmocidini]|uniref:trypsin-like peptidase domain-containing protein n=1 Tax=Streptomyces litmocidini TaxID=67318 RepID=UPI003701335C
MGRGDLATLVRICDPAGRPRGTGFLADHHGTVVTSHEAVDGLSRVVLHAPGDRTCLAEAEAVTPLPESGLALVRTEGLGGSPLPLATRPEIEPGTYVRIAAQGWREARVLGPAAVTYTAVDRFHALTDALELAIGTEGAEALRHGGQAAGGPVLDTVTGTVLAVLGTALHGDRRAAGYAVPLRPAGPLTALIRRNAATVPAYGPDLNLAAILELTATSVGPARDPDPWPEPVERPDCVREFARFTAGDAPVLALVGAPGTGRTTALAALCARRARGVAPAPTVRLRGADLRAEDRSLADAVGRALHQAGRIVAASGALGDTTTATPERAAALARDAGRPLLVLLDGPEEMPPLLAHRLADWTTATERWLRTHGAHLITACRPEHWEQAGTLYAPGALHRPVAGSGGPPGSTVAPGGPPGPVAGAGAGAPYHRPGAEPDAPHRLAAGPAGPPAGPGPATAATVVGGMPPAVLLGPYSETEARAVREGYGIGEADLATADARHPLALRLLAEVRAALPGEVPGRPGREEIFTAHLDLMCLRAAVRIAAGSRPLLRGTAVRRLAARVTGRVHEAARRCLGPGHGLLDRASFEELFPWREGWAPAVLTEGLLVPAGSGYRFAHEELADWVQAAHLDLDAALHALVHRHHEDPADEPGRPSGAAGGTAPGDAVRPRASASPGATGAPGEAAGAGTSRTPARPTASGGAAGPGAPEGAVLSPGASPVPAATGGFAGPGVPIPSAAPGMSPGGAGPWTPAGQDTPDDSGTPSASGEPGASGTSGGAGPRTPAERGASEVPGTPPGAAGSKAPGGGGSAGGSGSGAPAEVPPQRGAAGEALPVPRHRIGPVLQALLLLHRERGPAGLGPRLAALAEALGRFARNGQAGDGAWWAARLLGESVRRLPDPRPYLPVLRLLADLIGARPDRHPVFAPFGTSFWLDLPLGEDERIDLLRRLVPSDPPDGDRSLDAVAALLTADPRGVQPLLCRWFGDDRPTVAASAQTLLHAHRGLAVDDLCEALVATAHPLADGLLAVLAEDEPSALCRAVDRWAHDDGRPERRVAAAAYGHLVAGHATTSAARELLRYAALALLARPGDQALHGAALGLLVRDPHSRSRHLPRALAEPRVPAAALAEALATHPEEVLAAFRTRLQGTGEEQAAALRALAEVDTPALARRIAALVRDHAAHRPDGAPLVAAFVDRRLEDGPVARAVLFPLVTSLIRGRPAPLRRALAPVLAAPGTGASRHLRAELLDVLLEHERYEAEIGELGVLEALLRAAAEGAGLRAVPRTRELAHRVGALCVRTPEGAWRFDRALAGAVRDLPVFAALLAAWTAEAPTDWAPLLGPESVRALRSPGTAMPMRTDGRGHGSLRPA